MLLVGQLVGWSATRNFDDQPSTYTSLLGLVTFSYSHDHPAVLTIVVIYNLWRCLKPSVENVVEETRAFSLQHDLKAQEVLAWA